MLQHRLTEEPGWLIGFFDVALCALADVGYHGLAVSCVRRLLGLTHVSQSPFRPRRPGGALPLPPKVQETCHRQAGEQ
jgi:hypothetical protein